MYIYDQARILAKAVRESEQYKLMKRQKEKIEKDPELKKMFTDYRTKQFEIQKSRFMGQAISDETTQAFRQLHEIVTANLILKEFLEAEHSFSTMIADIQKILVEGLDLN